VFKLYKKDNLTEREFVIMTEDQMNYEHAYLPLDNLYDGIQDYSTPEISIKVSYS
jgi:hypothetical protein